MLCNSFPHSGLAGQSYAKKKALSKDREQGFQSDYDTLVEDATIFDNQRILSKIGASSISVL
jgi:hypothetical protein